jgi:hypothetical protein
MEARSVDDIMTLPESTVAFVDGLFREYARVGVGIGGTVSVSTFIEVTSYGFEPLYRRKLEMGDPERKY